MNLKLLSLEQFVLIATLPSLILSPSLVSCAAFAAASALYAFTLYLSSRDVKASDDTQAQVRALKERVDQMQLQRGLGR